MKVYQLYKSIIIFIFLFCTNVSFSQEDSCTVENNAFLVGERVVYKIYYNWNFVWIAAGEVEFIVKEDDKHYVVEAWGKTYRSYEVFFKVNDYYKTVIDKETFLPVEFTRNIEEGKYLFYNNITFNRKEGEVISVMGKTEEEATAREFQVEPCIQDILSTVYYLRNLKYEDMRRDGSFDINMFLDDKSYPISVLYEGEERIRVKGLGKFDAVHISPTIYAGMVFSQDSKLNIWVSSDENKVPLIIESPIRVGSIKAILKSYEGLRYPFNPIR